MGPANEDGNVNNGNITEAAGVTPDPRERRRAPQLKTEFRVCRI